MPDSPTPALGPHRRPVLRAPVEERLLSNVRAFLRRGKRPGASDARRVPSIRPPDDPGRRLH